MGRRPHRRTQDRRIHARERSSRRRCEGHQKFEDWHGFSPLATPSALYALFAYLRAPGDPEEVLRVAVGVGGDVDTVAAMAGAMVGAAVGLGGLTPRLMRWAQRLNDQGTFGFGELVAAARTVE
ncbi:ADP-ribosylglycohydrolase family protein [Mycobacterium sp. CSUR Q5927]|nr:ADP-ribosylglycohydrolase family protein [Mycobacterium sp. CSUR Q5927]